MEWQVVPVPDKTEMIDRKKGLKGVSVFALKVNPKTDVVYAMDACGAWHLVSEDKWLWYNTVGY